MAHLPKGSHSGSYIPDNLTLTEENLRNERDRRLEETDWMASSDVTMSNVWKTYRQALRDFPDNATYDAEGICNNWPVDPEDYYKV